MGDVDEKIFWVADERMSGDGGGGMRGPLCKASGPWCEAWVGACGVPRQRCPLETPKVGVLRWRNVV